MKFRILTLALSAALITGLLTSCSWFSKDDDEEKAKKEIADAKPADQMYDSAMALMDKGSYQKAIKKFQDIEKLYPFSPYSNKAKVMEAYAQYNDEEYDKSIAVIDDFVSLNPGNEEIPFMYYLKAICYYDRISDVKRDQDITLKAQSSFEELINRAPKSKYARDAQYKLDLIKDHLAAKEMEIGRYYTKRKNYAAAINRFQEVVRNYDDTEQVEEALYRLVEANLAMSFDEEALKYATILGYNYPASKWYKRAYELLGKNNDTKNQKTFVGKVLDTVGLGEEPASVVPAPLKSSPNIVDTGGWITDDSAIEDNAAKGNKDDVKPEAKSGETAPAGVSSNNSDANSPQQPAAKESDTAAPTK